jgi:lipoyl(octanoyl) transferase
VNEEILVVECGLLPYEEALVAQRWLLEARKEDEVADVLLLLEHPPTYTRGRRSGPDELPMAPQWYEAQGIEVQETDRGGRVTYHGPGQLVAYPIVSLMPYGDDVHEYVRRLERVAIAAIADFGVETQTIEGLTGIWTMGTAPGFGGAAGEARKIGSIGVHVSRGVTTHGFAINVNNDLQPFEWIVPCGIEGVRVTSLARELGSEQDFGAFTKAVVGRFCEVFERGPVPTEPAALGLDSARLGIG